jgi:hypothetical protein
MQVSLTSGGRSTELARCGPDCRSGELNLQSGQAITIRVAGAGGGSAALRLPDLPAADARATIDRLEQRMHLLATYRIDETLRPARKPLFTHYAFQAPDRMSFEVSNGSQAVFIGNTVYSRDEAGSSWHADRTPPVAVPSFAWDDSAVVAPVVLGQDQVDGSGVTVIAFFEQIYNAPVWFTLWVDAGGLVHRAESGRRATSWTTAITT